MTNSKRQYMSSVAALPCACCGNAGPVEVHHIRIGQGKSQKAGDFLVIPLCRQCHGQDLGSQGIHGDKTLLRIYRTDELKMLNNTIGEVFNRVSKL